MTMSFSPFPIPDHVPQELVHPFPFAYGTTVGGKPFDDVAVAIADAPDVFFAENVGPGGTPAWIIKRAKDLQDVYRDTENFTSQGFAPFAMILGENWSLVPAEIDPPEHTKYRKLLQPLFTPAAMKKLDDSIRNYAREEIISFLDKGGCDYMEDFAYKFPIKVFLELMGLPLDMAPQFLKWEMGLLHTQDMAELAASTRAVVDYLNSEIEERKINPKEDLISYAVNAEIDGKKLTPDELIGFAFLMFVGGLDTVSANMGVHALHLATNHEHQKFLRANPNEIPAAIEEMLRAYSPVTTFRTVVNEVEFKGVKMMPGDKVAMCTTLAGRDASEYEDPSDVRLDRNPRHNAFGFGVHLCLGIHLARRELRIAIEEFLELVPEFSLESSSYQLKYHTGVLQPVALPLKW